MAGKDNLIPQAHILTVGEQSAGGKKSVETRKEKKLLKELLEEALSKKTKTGNKYVDITNALVQQAEKGNTKAYEIIQSTLEQKPKENISIIAEVNNPFTGMTTEELRKIANSE